MSTVVKNFRPVTDEELKKVISTFEEACATEVLENHEAFMQRALRLAENPCECGNQFCAATVQTMAAQIFLMKVALLQRFPHLSKLH